MTISKITKDNNVLDYLKSQILATPDSTNNNNTDTNCDNSTLVLYTKAAAWAITPALLPQQQQPQQLNSDIEMPFGKNSVKNTILELVKLDTEIRRWLISQITETCLVNQVEDLKKEIKDKITPSNNTTPTLTNHSNGARYTLRKPSSRMISLNTLQRTQVSLPVPSVTETEEEMGEPELLSHLKLSHNNNTTTPDTPHQQPTIKITHYTTPDTYLMKNQPPAPIYLILDEKIHRLVYIQKKIEEKDILFLIKLGNLYLKGNYYPPLCCSIIGSELGDLAVLSLMKKFKIQFIKREVSSASNMSGGGGGAGAGSGGY